MTDRRLTPANDRVAHISLRGAVDAPRFVSGTPARIAVPLTDLCATPGGARDRQLLMGAEVLVLDRQEGHAFLRAEADGYCGYVAESALAPPMAATHWVAAPSTHLFSAPSIKVRDVALLSLGARVRVTDTAGSLAQTPDGWVPRQHLRALGDWRDDPVSVAESLIGSPYLWGGNSRSGIDCSGLVQVAYFACGRACPGDSDLQMAGLGTALPATEPLRRGDLLFWKGHVALVCDGDRLIHANGHSMNVAYEDIAGCLARIERTDAGTYLGARRPA
jgi:cell wall-associated NlpC family hydrolase